MKIEHIAIWCRDLEGLKSFYETFFGARSNEKYSNPQKGFESYFLSFDQGPRLELMSANSIPDSKDDPILDAMGITHLAFSVGSEEEVDGLTKRLREGGFQVLSEPRRTGDGYYESVVLDPEHNHLEITT